MKNIFDYTYYRTAKRHFKRDGAEAFTAILTISFIIFLYCIPLFSIINSILGKSKSSNHKILLIFLGILIFYFVKSKYNGKYFMYGDKWINETKNEKLFGEIIILMFFFSPLLFMFIINYYW